MGNVFETYINFGECGNPYLSRILVGLDPNSTNVGDLSPYFKKDMNDDVIKQGMTCMYGDLFEKSPQFCFNTTFMFCKHDLSHKIHKRGHRQKSRTHLFYVTMPYAEIGASFQQ